jgi:hypothetical protein
MSNGQESSLSRIHKRITFKIAGSKGRIGKEFWNIRVKIMKPSLLSCITNRFKRDNSVKKECPFHMMTPGSDLDLLVFVKQYDPLKFNPIKNRPGSNKPEGGLWSSPFNPDTGSEWIEWMNAEHFNIPCKDSLITFLRVNNDGKFLVINTLNDLIDILNIFQVKSEHEYYDPVLDYEELSMHVDGIYLTSKGQWATRLTRPSLYGWDCETVLIMNPKVIEYMKQGKIEEKWILTDINDDSD